MCKSTNLRPYSSVHWLPARPPSACNTQNFMHHEMTKYLQKQNIYKQRKIIKKMQHQFVILVLSSVSSLFCRLAVYASVPDP